MSISTTSVGVGSTLVNLTFHVGALLAATDPAYAAVLGPSSGDALALLMLDLHQYGYVLGGVSFGLWLLPMGYIAYRSPMFPTALGVLAIVGCLAWIADPVIAFALPDRDVVRDVVSVPTFFGGTRHHAVPAHPRRRVRTADPDAIRRREHATVTGRP